MIIGQGGTKNFSRSRSPTNVSNGAWLLQYFPERTFSITTEALEDRLERLSTTHPWFSEDKSTQEMIELLAILTNKRTVDRELLEEKIGSLERRIGELESKFDHSDMMK
jgi:hypothetical protein